MTGKERLLKAAFQLFSEKGYSAVGIREIGEKAGLSNPALYQHFSGKRELGLEVYRRAYADVLSNIDRRITVEMSPVQKLENFIEILVSLSKQKPSPFQFLESETRHFGQDMIDFFGDRIIVSQLSSWIDEGRERGMIRGDQDTRILVAVILGQITKWADMADLGLAPKKGAASALKTIMHDTLRIKNTPHPIQISEPQYENI